MITALTNRNYYLRFAFSVMLLVFTGCKIVTPVCVLVKIAYKEITSTPDTDNDKAEELADAEKAVKRSPEFITFDHNPFSPLLCYIKIIHHTAYTNHYQTGNYQTITAPPPDIYLHSIV